MKRKDKKHTALFSAFVLISIALIFIAGLSFHFPTASILVVVLIWLFAVAVFSGMSSQEIENAFVNGAKKGSAAILLLLCVGVIVSMWIQSGMVPMIIYYGLGLFSPQIFLLALCPRLFFLFGSFDICSLVVRSSAVSLFFFFPLTFLLSSSSISCGR